MSARDHHNANYGLEDIPQTRDNACPKCGEDCDRDSVDVGVGMIYGPYGCSACGWSEDSEYDLSGEKNPVDEKGGVIDQWGGYHPPGSPRANAFKLLNEIGVEPKIGWRDPER